MSNVTVQEALKSIELAEETGSVQYLLDALNDCKAAPTFQREGWKLVPFRDDLITEEMKRALFINLIHADDESYVIKAIIAAAPTDTE